MSRPAIVLIGLLICAGLVRADEKVDSCVTCHAALADQLSAPVEGMKRDVHTEHGFSCVDCHGGDEPHSPRSLPVLHPEPEKEDVDQYPEADRECQV